MGGGRARQSAFDDELLLQEVVADAVAQISLQFDRLAGYGAAGAARALELVTEGTEKGDVTREAGHHGHGLPAAPFLLHAELCDDFARLRRKRLVGRLRAALAVAGRPATSRAHAAGAG